MQKRLIMTDNLNENKPEEIDASTKRSKLSTNSLIIKLGLLSIILLSIVIAFSFYGILVRSFFTDKQWIEIAKEHTSAIVGLPIAAVTAFLLVAILQITTNDKIELKAPGFVFSGSSGQIALWIACFLAMTAAIKILW